MSIKQKKPYPPAVNGQYQDRILNKIKSKIHALFTLCFQVLKVLLIKICEIQPPDLFLLLFLLAFTSTDIIFHKCLELHSTLSEKNAFVTSFSFLTNSLNPHFHPVKGQNLLSMAKVFCWFSVKQTLGQSWHYIRNVLHKSQVKELWN